MYIKRLNIISILLLAILNCSYSSGIKVILDTDMDSDIDDVTALAMMHYFADQGEAEILATISCSSNRYSVELIDAINTFFNRPDIPVAVPAGNAPVHSWVLKADKLSGEFPHDANVNNSPGATKLYRKILSKQPDSSVIIVTLGYLTNLKSLLESTADEYSNLPGKELVARKVKKYYCMGNVYPSDTKPAGVWGNFRPDPVSTDYVNQNWPTQIIFTGGGNFAESIGSGNGLKSLPNDNIVRRTYELAKGDDTKDWTHHSADIITVWIAIKGKLPYFEETLYGYNEIDQYGRNAWKTDHDVPAHSYISDMKPGVHPEEAGLLFDSVFARF